MINDTPFSPTFWMYFSYVLSFVTPLFCGITLLMLKGESSNEKLGMHPRRLLGIILTLTGLVFIPNIIQDILLYQSGKVGIPAFDITINLFLIPLYFFYFRKLTKPEKLNRQKIWYHLFPAIIAFTIGLFIFPFEEKITLYEQELNNKLSFAALFRYFCFFMQAVLIISYSLRILQLKRQHVRNLEENYSSTENIDLKWLNQAIPFAVIYGGITLFTTLWTIEWTSHLSHISAIFFIFYLFIYALNEPYIHYTIHHAGQTTEEMEPECETILEEIHLQEPDPLDSTSPVFPALPQKYLKNLGAKREKMKDELVRLFDEKEIYTNGALTINDVANLLSTNRTYISNLINNEFGFSFYQFVNKFRIQKATILFLENPKMQIQEVASLSGFNSLSSFISAFKLNEGITPKEWKQRYTSVI